MASTKVIATTWAKKDLVAKLKATLKRMDEETIAFEKEMKAIDKKQEAWDKKAEAWVKKNLNKTNNVRVNYNYHGYNIYLDIDDELIEEALGKRPEYPKNPGHKNTSYNQDISNYEQVENAIALVEGSTDTEFKINTTSTWASFIR